MDIKWKSEYNINNYTIDKEHQKLFLIANKAINIKDENEKSNKLKNILKELYTYTSLHFTNEEKFMESISYPDLNNHKKLHIELLVSLNKIVLNFNKLKLEEIHTRLNSFIYNYFVNHIIKQDKKIRLFTISIDELKQKFGWKDVYKVGNELIDSEHKKLFEITAEAFCIVEDSKRSEEVKDIVTRLHNYIKTHFSHEEEYMEKISYPDINEHKKLHKDMIIIMTDFIEKLPTMNIETFERNLVELMDIVLLEHIIQEDSKLASFAQKS